MSRRGISTPRTASSRNVVETGRITSHVVRRTFLLGSITGLLAAIVMTAIDWRANPGGVFAGPDGTHWQAVIETAWSWFWPVAALAVVVSAPIVFLLARRGTAAEQ